MAEHAAAQETYVRLVEEYQFDPSLAEAAVAAIPDKGDLELAIDWLLENGAPDKGGAVTVKQCPHVPERLIDATFCQKCADCDAIDELWLCLVCGEARCGRYQKKHALEHFQTTGHHLAVGLADLSTWCYLCNAYTDTYEQLVKGIRDLKFGAEVIGQDLDGACPHGTNGREEWSRPRVSRLVAGAVEYNDDAVTLKEKVSQVAKMLRSARYAVVYSGGGGVTTHGLIGEMIDRGLVKTWINLDQDALPQRAGVPEAKVIDIHGSQFDPSNPPRETLRRDLAERLVEMEAEADFVLALTAPTGLTADRVPGSVATRARGGNGFGVALVSAHRSDFDHHCQLRIFAPVDDVISALAGELGVVVVAQRRRHPVPSSSSSSDVYVLAGYDPVTGVARRDGSGSLVLDLTVGRTVLATNGDDDVGTVVGKDNEGNYLLRFGTTERRLGRWWLFQPVPRFPLVQHEMSIHQLVQHESIPEEEEDEVKD